MRSRPLTINFLDSVSIFIKGYYKMPWVGGGIFQRAKHNRFLQVTNPSASPSGQLTDIQFVDVASLLGEIILNLPNGTLPCCLKKVGEGWTLEGEGNVVERINYGGSAAPSISPSISSLSTSFPSLKKVHPLQPFRLRIRQSHHHHQCRRNLGRPFRPMR